MFTQEQIEFINSLIDARLQTAAAHRFSNKKNYHTVHEIRHVFLLHIDEFRQLIAGQVFTLNVMRFFLKTKIDLLSGDLELNPSGKTCTRFDRQVANALCPENWPNSPISRAANGRRGHYELRVAWTHSTA